MTGTHRVRQRTYARAPRGGHPTKLAKREQIASVRQELGLISMIMDLSNDEQAIILCSLPLPFDFSPSMHRALEQNLRFSFRVKLQPRAE
mgnify:CR=1 FL=1